MLKNHGYWKFGQYSSFILLMLFIHVQCIFAFNHHVIAINHSTIRYISVPVKTISAPLRFEKRDVDLGNSPIGISRSSTSTYHVSMQPAFPNQHHRLQRRCVKADRYHDGEISPVESAASTFVSENRSYTPRVYSERKPFEETFGSSMLASSTILSSPMRATEEDDPDFPGDPGQMPVGDGVWFLIGASILFILLRSFLIKKKI